MGPTADQTDVQADLHSMARSMRLRMYAVHVGAGVVVLLLFFAVEHWANSILALLAITVTGAIWYLPLFDPNPGRLNYSTEKSRSKVLEEFTSDCPPVLALRCQVAEHISQQSSGDEFSLENADGSELLRYRIEQPDEREIRITGLKNDDRQGVYTVFVEEDEGRTALEMEYEQLRRLNVMRLTLNLVNVSIFHKMMRVQGYEPESTGLIGF